MEIIYNEIEKERIESDSTSDYIFDLIVIG